MILLAENRRRQTWTACSGAETQNVNLGAATRRAPQGRLQA